MSQEKARTLIRGQLYRVDDLFVRSEAEAKVMAAQCTISARALIMRAEAQSTLSADSWTGFYRALDEAERRAAGDWRTRLRDAARSLRRHRRLAISSIILVLILGFFTLVPAGRAIAEGIFNYVATIIENQLQIDQADEKALYEQRGYDVPETLTQEQTAEYGYDEDGNLIMEKKPVNYDSVAAFESASGQDAFELVSSQLTCVEVVENNNIFTGKSLRTSYRTADDLSINVIEKWYKGDGQSVSFSGEIKQKTVLDGRTIQYAIDTQSGVFDGVVLLDNSILVIYADAGVDVDLIWDLLS
ncbi:MAG: hypothetical protein ABFC56_03125 [Clostridiaceae bacterium]